MAALFDVDKNSIDRGSPAPNRPDQLDSGAKMNHGTNSVNPVTNATPTAFLTGGSGIIRILRSDTVSGTTSDTSQTFTATIPHNLGYIPAALVYALPPPNSDFAPFTTLPTTNADYVQLPFFYYYQAGSPSVTGSIILYTISFDIDSTNLYLRVNQWVTGLSITTHSFSFRYYILQETAT